LAGIVVAIAACSVVLWFATPSGTTGSAAITGAPAGPGVGTAGPAALPVPAPLIGMQHRAPVIEKAAGDEPRGGHLRLPDGSGYVPNLNGVTQPMEWTAGRFTPIVGINRTDTGIDWYVHEDGSQSTTVMITTERLGVVGEEGVLVFAGSDPGAVRPRRAL
jgi:hypothetical protein